jgi:hypothetical protein
MKGGEKWNCHLKEFNVGGTNSARQQVMNAVAGDEYGIGFAEVQTQATRVKTVALSHDDGDSGLLPTRKNISAVSIRWHARCRCTSIERRINRRILR